MISVMAQYWRRLSGGGNSFVREIFRHTDGHLLVMVTSYNENTAADTKLEASSRVGCMCVLYDVIAVFLVCCLSVKSSLGDIKVSLEDAAGCSRGCIQCLKRQFHNTTHQH